MPDQDAVAIEEQILAEAKAIAGDLKRLLRPFCQTCVYASEPFNLGDPSDWHFCIKIFERIDCQLDFVDDPMKVRPDFGCVLYKDKKVENE